MPVPQQGKRQRRWAPKTRSGCKTCKIRKKKCDEKRPSCSRCVKDKFPCDGYEPPKAWVFEPGEAPRVVTVRCSSSDSGSLRSPSTKDESIPSQTREETEDVDRVGPWELVRRDTRLSEFLFEPSSPWTSSLDQNYTQYFLLKTAPLLSSTRRWQNFWQSIVPQAAWANPSVRHAMIAVSLTFDTYVSGTDHKAMIHSRRNQAINTFATEPSSSWEVGLIICRLFSSMAQCNEDFEAALTHMKAGEKMLLEASRSEFHRSSEVVRLMAATFMGLFADSTIDFDVIKRFPPTARRKFRTLQKICSEYARMLRRVTHQHHEVYDRILRSHDSHVWEKTIEQATMGFLSVVFTTLNQSISSVMYPDILVFQADEGIVPVTEVRETLVEQGKILTFDQLGGMYHALFDDVEAYFSSPCLPPSSNPLGPSPKYILPGHLRTRLMLFVDNYVVQASELEPRMTAGTFWLPPESMPGCMIHENLKPTPGNPIHALGSHEPLPACAHDRGPHLKPPSGVMSCLHRPDGVARAGMAEEDERTRERREFYHEFVCQYRSGFMM